MKYALRALLLACALLIVVSALGGRAQAQEPQLLSQQCPFSTADCQERVSDILKQVCPGSGCVDPQNWADLVYALLATLCEGKPVCDPTSHLPVVNSEVIGDMFLDEDGALAPTPPVLASPSVVAPTVGLTLPPSETFAVALEEVPVTVGSSTVMVQRPVANCRPSGPSTNHYYDRDNNPPNWYGSGVGVTCTGTKNTNCHTLLIRNRDNTAVAWDRDSHVSSCVAWTWHGYYKRRTNHFSDNDVVMEAASGIWFKHGDQYSGWDCRGWKTPTLGCSRQTANVK